MKTIFFLFQFITASVYSQNIDSIITKESLYTNVSFLASDSLKGRLTGSQGNLIAADYIKQYFKNNGIKPINVFPNYYDSFLVQNTIQALNVVSAVKGYGSDSLIIVSAHYDHIGRGASHLSPKLPVNNDDIYNGANDNATGTAAMMEIAKYYATTNENYYTIIFVAFSAEELWLLGSTHFINGMDNPGLIKAVINLEMLGRPIYKKQCYYTGFVNYKTIKGFNKIVNNATAINNYFVNDPFPEQHLEMRSDHYPFSKAVSQAFTIMASSPTDEHYHAVTDETATIDFDFLCNAVKNIALAIQYFNP